MRRNKIILKFVILFLTFSILTSSTSSSQPTKQVTPDLLAGKWVGSVQVELRAFDKRGKLEGAGASSIEIINLCVKEYKESDAPSEESMRALGADPTMAKIAAKIRNSFDGWAKFTASNEFYDTKGRVFEIWSLKNGSEVIELFGHFSKDGRVFFGSDASVMVKREFIGRSGTETIFEELEFRAFSIGGLPPGGVFIPGEGVNFVIDGDRIIIKYDGQKEGLHQKVAGELYRIELQKKTIPKDIQPNEPIETDKKTRIEITIPDIGKVNIAENTKAKFKSENLLEVVKGKIHGFIKKLKPKTKFEVNSPTCILAVRGTEYAFNVEDDGTTTLIVLDGEVEFSDKEKKKTVLVKKNQHSVVKPGELPSEPVDISINRVPKWWE